MPYARAINPITGTNWEGSGVEPDVAVPAEDALAVAHSRALEIVAARSTDADVKAEAKFLAGVLRDRRRPVTLSADQLLAFAGTYGPRVIELEDGVLFYQRNNRPRLRLSPVGNDQFLVAEMNDFRLRFERDPDGQVVRIVGLYPLAEAEPHERAPR